MSQVVVYGRITVIRMGRGRQSEMVDNNKEGHEGNLRGKSVHEPQSGGAWHNRAGLPVQGAGDEGALNERLWCLQWRGKRIGRVTLV